MENFQELLNQVGNKHLRLIYSFFSRIDKHNYQKFNKLYKFFLILFKKITQFVPIKCNNKVCIKNIIKSGRTK